MAHHRVGYSTSSQLYTAFFSADNIEHLSRRITVALQGKYVVTDRVIRGVMDNLFENYTPRVADMYSRCFTAGPAAATPPPLTGATAFTGPRSGGPSALDELNDRVVHTITSAIADEDAIAAVNASYSAAAALYGDFNPYGLQAVSNSSIKLNHRRPSHGQFNMRY
jgi:hypothetical protein